MLLEIPSIFTRGFHPCQSRLNPIYAQEKKGETRAKKEQQTVYVPLLLNCCTQGPGEWQVPI